jgi:hypothetical protein
LKKKEFSFCQRKLIFSILGYMLGGERLFKIVGIVVGRDRPKVQVYFVVKSLGFERLIWFVVDTGSGFSALGARKTQFLWLSTVQRYQKQKRKLLALEDSSSLAC